jgi:dTDP-4-dehydrorhamnose 3,5-epimerase
MKIEPLDIPDVLLIRPAVMTDTRGYFVETFNKRKLGPNIGDVEFVQDNQSLSRDAFTIRGLHFQIQPFAQVKLIRVLQGSIVDVALDIRKGSKTYGKHVKAVLTARGFEQLWVPVGFAHGFCTLEANSAVFYKVTNFYDASCERGIRWDDPELAIDWGVNESEVMLSAKDQQQPPLRDLPSFF